MPRSAEITADSSLAQARRTNAYFKSLLDHPHGHHGVSVREDCYKGHRIVIRTTYEIEIDGQPFAGNLDVSNSGTVQYHGIPNVSAPSAVELIRSVIDSFPEDFAADGPAEAGHHHDGAVVAGHHHEESPAEIGHDHAGHAPRRRKRPARTHTHHGHARGTNRKRTAVMSRSREKHHAGSHEHSQ